MQTWSACTPSDQFADWVGRAAALPGWDGF